MTYYPILFAIMMLFLHLYKTIFLLLFCFHNIVKYILNIAGTTRKMKINKLRDFILEN